MSFAAGFGAGMGAGVACGVATGMASRKKDAREEVESKLRAVAEVRGITIRDQSGREIPISEFLDEALEESEAPKCKAALMVSVALGVLLLLLGAGTAVYLVVRG